MPSMLRHPAAAAAGTRGTPRRGLPSRARRAPLRRRSPGAGNPGTRWWRWWWAGEGGGERGRRQGGRGTDGEPGVAEPWDPGRGGGSGAAGGVRSAARRAPCPLRPRVPAAGTRGKRWGSRRDRAASLAAPRSAPRPRSRALAGGSTHHQPWLRSRLPATIFLASRAAGLRLPPAPAPAPRRGAPAALPPPLRSPAPRPRPGRPPLPCT